MKDARFKLKIRSLMIVVLTFVFGLNVNAQKVSVSGTVKDNTGEPVIGASVVEKGTTNGLTTNFNGEFTLSVSPNATLVISYIGYKTQEIPTLGQRSLIITLEEDARVLGEVVAIGYATVKKEDATGAVSAIKPEELNKGLTTNAQDMITGKIAGVNVTSDGGTPGGGATIRIRGGSSLNASNDPLVVVDGLAMSSDGIKGVSNFLSTINPNDIESFTVLKDASATAIYGSRASNGVIIITTKKGKSGSKPKLSYDGTFSVGTSGNYMDVLTAAEFKKYVTDLYGEGSDAYNKLGSSNTNWQSQVLRTALSHDHNLDITGGFKNFPYRVSFGYTNQNGIIKTSNFERYTGAVNLSPSLLNDYLKINLNAKGMYIKNRFVDGGILGAAIAMDPTQSVYATSNNNLTGGDVTGGYYQWMDNATTINSNAVKNPVATLMLQDHRGIAKDFIGGAEIDYKLHFLPDVHAHLNLGMEMSDGKDTYLNDTTSAANLHHGYTGWDKQKAYNKSLSYYMQYIKEFSNQKVDLMGGYEWQHFHHSGNKYGEGLDGYIYQTKLNEWASENYLVSFFGRLNYAIAEKYLFTATLRDDGSSRFAPENRWSLFPSFAFAWKIINEDFLKGSKSFSDLKLRLGYGKTGQQNIGSSDYQYIQQLIKNKDGAYYLDTVTYRVNAFNPKLKWETTTTYNAGIDFGFLNGRINGAIDYYYRITDNLLNTVAVAAGTNYQNMVLTNIGSLWNQGLEFSINAKPISENDITWDLGYNITFNRNKITKLIAQEDPSYKVTTGDISVGTGGKAQAHAVGFPAYSFYVYQQVYDKDGKPIDGLFVDRNGDGKITADDKYYYHNPSPDFTMGFSSKLVYKQFDFGFNLRASIGNYVYNDAAASRSDVGKGSIYANGFLANKPTSAFKTNFIGLNEYYLSDYYVEKASFLRVDNITVGYSFNKILGVISSGRIYSTIQNPFLFTNYTGIDPEVFNGIDRNIYPRPITGIVGISLNF